MNPNHFLRLEPRIVGALTLAALILHQSGCQSAAYQAIMEKAKPLAPVLAGVGTAVLVKGNKNSTGEAIAAGVAAGILTHFVIKEISAAQERQAQRRLEERESDLAAQRERYLKAEKEGRSEPRYAAIEIAPEAESKSAAHQTTDATPAANSSATASTNSPAPSVTNDTSTEAPSPDPVTKPAAPTEGGDSTAAASTVSTSTPAADAATAAAPKRQSFVIYDLKNAQFVGTSVVEVRQDTPLADAAILSIKGEDQKQTDAVVYAMR
jgi:hypothetical protein